MKAFEIIAHAGPETLSSILGWYRANDRNLYRAAISKLATPLKLRPVFVERKPVPEQFAWIGKQLSRKQADDIALHLLDAYLMGAQQPMLSMFCETMGIPHDGKGTITGELPQQLDPAKLDDTIAKLMSSFDPAMVTVYLRCFNLQRPDGWPELTAKLAAPPQSSPD